MRYLLLGLAAIAGFALAFDAAESAPLSSDGAAIQSEGAKRLDAQDVMAPIDPSILAIPPETRAPTTTAVGHISSGGNTMLPRTVETIVGRLRLDPGIYVVLAKAVVYNWNGQERVLAACRLWRDESEVAAVDPAGASNLDYATVVLQPSNNATLSLIGAIEVGWSEVAVATVSCTTSAQADGEARWVRMAAVPVMAIDRQ